MSTITINESQQLYVIPHKDGYSCYGFENCFRDCEQLAEKLKREDLKPDAQLYGTEALYERYQQLIKLAAKAKLSTWFEPGTPRPLQKVFEKLRNNRRTCRLFYGDAETGRDWLEENDVIGCIGRSSGALKIPLLIAEGDCGGPAVLTKNTVKVMVKDSDFNHWASVYQHPGYHLPVFSIEKTQDAERPYAVKAGESVIAGFSHRRQADKLIAFYEGRVMQVL